MSQKTVLIIEDDAETLTLLRDGVLAPAGYSVLTATDGQEGLQHALLDRPDVILLDLMLPCLSGLDVLDLLQQQDCHIPVIVLTAYGSEQAILEAFRLGAKSFLQKPIGVDEVGSAIEKALAEEQLRQERENLTQALAQANQRLQQQVQNWATLNEIAQVISSTLEESEVFRRVMENVTLILQVEACSLLLLDQETNELEFSITLRGDEARYSSYRLKLGQGIAGWVAQHGEPLLIPDVRQDTRFYAQVDQETGFQSHSILCVPLKAKEKVIGVLEAINKQGESGDPSFTQEDLELLTTLASWVAVAVENAWLNRATKEMAAVTALKQTVTAMAHHINNRLMAFSLELDSLEAKGPVDQEAVGAITASARRSIRDVSAVIKALDQLEEIRTVPYAGTAEMIDIEEALKEQLSHVETQHWYTKPT
ncbi:MAG: response regulator [Chloroflexi bacterium]|nr:response regulator [Chloroflexota bacterium]